MIADDTRRLFRETRSAKTWIQMFLDQIVVQGLLAVHTYQRTGGFDEEYRVLAIIVFLLMQVIYRATNVYHHEYSRNDYVTAMMQAWGILVVTLGVFGFVTKTSEDYSRLVLLTWAVTGFFGQMLVFYFTRRFTESIRTIVIGGGELGAHIARNINSNSWIPDQVIGYIGSDDDTDVDVDWGDIPKLGILDDINQVVETEGPRRVYIALPMEEAKFTKDCAGALVEQSLDVIWAPDIFGVSLVNPSVKEIAGVPLISLSETPLVGGSALAKDVMDKFLSMVILIILLPVMLITAIAIKLTSSGPILFHQSRHGWDGRLLEVYKFRSMKVHEEAEGQVTQASKDDARITPVGRFIRKTSIDELPQLFNVLSGSMSLVGPRPHAVAHNEFYSDQIQSYMLRHRIKPGLTGLAQVNGYRGETETIEKMQARVKYDLVYINNWSIWLDIEILYRTLFVLFGKNAY